MNHTPGPWKARGYVVIDAEENYVGRTLQRAVPKYNHLDDARLFAAAPDMLEALQIIPPEKLELLADWIDLHFPDDENPEVQNDLRAMATKAREVIKKARGK